MKKINIFLIIFAVFLLLGAGTFLVIKSVTLNSITNTCNLGSWSVQSYDTSSGTINIVGSISQVSNAGCLGTPNYNGASGVFDNINDPQTCQILFGSSGRWDSNFGVCYIENTDYLNGKDISYSGQCFYTCKDTGGCLLVSDPNHLNYQQSGIYYSESNNFDGSRMNFQERFPASKMTRTCSETVTISEPAKPTYTGSNPTPSSFWDSVSLFFSQLKNWFIGLFYTPQSIVGNNGNIVSGQQVSYTLDIQAPLEINQPGLRTWTYGKWGVIDSNNKVIINGTVDEVTNGLYSKQVTFNAPNNPGNYAVIGIITQINNTWDSTNGWVQTPETFIKGEGINLVTQAPVYVGSAPQAKSFGETISAFFQNIINFFKGLFGGN